MKDYNLYSIFARCCELKSYSKVAQALGLSTHHIVSDKMQTLSNQLGVPLFVRHSRGMEPTSEALVLYEKIRPLYAGIDLVSDSIREFNENSEAVIRMIVPETFASIYLADFFAEFNKKYPNIKFQSFSRTSSENYDLFLLGKIDFIIEQDYICKKFDLDFIDLMTLNLAFISTKSFLKNRGLNQDMRIDDLVKLPIATHRENAKNFTSETGIKLDPFFELATLQSVYSFVRGGSFVGIYVREYLEKDSEVVPITVNDIEKMPTATITCGYHKHGLSNASQIFIDNLVRFCKERN